MNHARVARQLYMGKQPKTKTPKRWSVYTIQISSTAEEKLV